MIGTVTSATIDEKRKQAYYGVTAADGKSCIITGELTDEEIEDYRAHKDAYFGVIQPASGQAESSFELFEWMVERHQQTTKEALLTLVKGAPHIDKLSTLSREELVLEICERMVATIVAEHETTQSTATAKT